MSGGFRLAILLTAVWIGGWYVNLVGFEHRHETVGQAVVSWTRDCNSGGMMAATDITTSPDRLMLPRNRLMQVPELRALGALPA